MFTVLINSFSQVISCVHTFKHNIPYRGSF